MNYQNIYNSIIFRGQTRETPSGYTEEHHIIPKCLGGTNEKENLVRLTSEEHFVCHKLLCKLHPNNSKLLFALDMMSVYTKGQSDHRMNNKLFGALKEKVYNTKKEFYRKTKVSLNCLHCEKQFETHFCYSNERKFCCLACKRAYPKTIRVPITCIICGTIFMVKPAVLNTRFFCSNSCRSNGRRDGLQSTRACKGCGIKLTGSLRSNYYCSSECKMSFKARERL